MVVFPQPGELMLHSKKRFEEMGKEVPADAVNNMLGTNNISFFTPLLFKRITFLYPHSLIILACITFWQPFMSCLSARICLVQMSTLIR